MSNRTDRIARKKAERIARLARKAKWTPMPKGMSYVVVRPSGNSDTRTFTSYAEAQTYAKKIGGNVYGAGDPAVTGREASPSSQDNASEKPDVLDWSYSSGFETNRSKH